MSTDHVSKTIEMVQGQIAELDQQLLVKKQMVNGLCEIAGRPPIYGDAEMASRTTSTTTRPDEYYGKALATVVRTVLEKRKSANLGAATANEIYDEMVAGGFHFQAKNDDNAKRGLYSSLGKNTSTFHRLPNGTWGLIEWYPDRRSAKAKSNGDDEADDEVPLHEELKQESGSKEEPAEPVKTAK
jgi:hypothetical protein